MINIFSKKSHSKPHVSKMKSWLPSAQTIIRKVKKASSKLPFLEDVLSMYACAIDPETPRKIKILAAGTLLYLIVPADFIPDFFAILGYTDDITALMIMGRAISSHISDKHRDRAKEMIINLAKDDGGSDGVEAVS